MTDEDTAIKSSVRQGVRADQNDMKTLIAAIRAAVDYRGDVTVTRTDDSSVTGYLFDLAEDRNGSGSILRLIPADGARVSIPLDDVASIELTGKDTAEGKSFETWVRKYVEKKLAGERASIESEPLTDE